MRCMSFYIIKITEWYHIHPETTLLHSVMKYSIKMKQRTIRYISSWNLKTVTWYFEINVSLKFAVSSKREHTIAIVVEGWCFCGSLHHNGWRNFFSVTTTPQWPWCALPYHWCLGIAAQAPVKFRSDKVIWNQIMHRLDFSKSLNKTYRQTSSIWRTLVGNKTTDHSDVVGAATVNAAATTSSFST